MRRSHPSPRQGATPPRGSSSGAAASRDELRRSFEIPDDAERVLVFTESSHWDTNWLRTSDEYFTTRIEPIFEHVMAALEKDPGRIYCIESIFFLKLYWDRHPESRDRLRALLEQRAGAVGAQLRILGSSYTTPDTLLPHPEALLRDYLLGQDWLRSQGLHAYPRTAYFPDNFGHSPHLPSLMRAVGVDSIGVTRIDGMYFVASDFRSKGSYPLRGSTAELLQNELRTLDFIWKDDDGAEVLCHWNAFTYFQGDMLAHAGIIRWNGHVAAIPWRTGGHVARRIASFVRDLAPLSRTPYLLCPIGMDFNDPIADLRELLDRYNRERYPDTGVWTLVAGLDDYFRLVRAHSAALPVLAVDPNPYWMGFYASRPELKQRPTRVARALVLAEKLSALDPPDAALDAALRNGWEHVVLMNHHDAITGTSPDRVTHAEQRQWLDKAEAASREALRLATVRSGPPSAPEGTLPSGPTPRFTRTPEGVEVETDWCRATFSKTLGGAMTSFVAFGEEQLAGVGFDLVAHADEGGLWRLGHEYRGGGFEVIDRTSRRPAEIEVTELAGGGLAVSVSAKLERQAFVRTATFRPRDRFVHLAVEGAAARRHTVTCRFELVDTPATLEMGTIGGTIERPRERGHKPTFWPVPSLLSVRGPARALHVGFEAATAVSLSPRNELEWIVARNSPKERAYWLLPVLAHPIGGTTDEPQSHRSALFVTPSAGDRSLAPEIARALELAWFPDELRAAKRFARTLVQCDDPSISFAAIKRADVGPGVVARLACERPAHQVVHVSVASRAIVAAWAADAREEDAYPLEIVDGRVRVPIARRLTTIRFVLGDT